ncbi:hypothetical protein FisN_20Hh051 [Fistulifera solaris]|jgi:hypothetical protein|uniref:Uncharacterized protein n=1 Tax=Fistulifera solaris TaxID=1519565 RepID=A0A1Z5KC83_FISSO|nr:hypothetical protein FisN_20Hh051 [Fistulifera solaris]|eukprot:GAX23847.1 hypothetical protein FisN_20Hh051 [Fistulifera solaris]
MISQEYFDEIYLENVEAFDLSPEEAIEETIQQLQKQQSVSLLQHLTLTPVDSEVGKEIRQKRAAFLQAVEESSMPFSFMRSCLNEKENQPETIEMFRNLMIRVQPGLATLLLHIFEDPDAKALEFVVIDLLQLPSLYPGVLPSSANGFLSELRNAISPLFVSSYLNEVNRIQENGDDHCLEHLVTLGYWSCRHCESNKQTWINTSIADGEETRKARTLAPLLVAILQKPNVSEQLIAAVGNWIILLCTFDEFRSSSSSDGPAVQASHHNVGRLAENGAIVALYQHISSGNAAILFSALRAMAIQDDTVQTMVAMGIVASAVEAWRQCTDHTTLATALMGLFRNLCANDDLKTSLCRGTDWAIVNGPLPTTLLRQSALLAEHLCGTVAAMALRQPENGHHLVKAEWHKSVVEAMEHYKERGSLQRQGALAIRNLVSRSKELIAPILQAGAEAVLYKAAANHVNCQDEIYAALRDLDLVQPGSMRKYEVVEGKVVAQENSQLVFGERNPNFRPIFDD